MITSPGVRRFALTTHVATSVAWLGAVGAFLALSVAGQRGSVDAAQAAYVSMNLVGAWVIVPLSIAALASGTWVSLGTTWGLVRHYWLLVKFALTILATLLLLLHQFTAVARAAQLATEGMAGAELAGLGKQLVMDASLAIGILIVTTGLSVYKPWGRTPYGIRAEQQERVVPATAARLKTLRWGIAVAAGLLVSLFLVIHVAGGGMGRH